MLTSWLMLFASPRSLTDLQLFVESRYVFHADFCAAFQVERAARISFLKASHAARTSVRTSAASVCAYAAARADARAAYAFSTDVFIAFTAVPSAVSRVATAVPMQATSTFALLRNSTFCARSAWRSAVFDVPVAAWTDPATRKTTMRAPAVMYLVIGE